MQSAYRGRKKRAALGIDTGAVKSIEEVQAQKFRNKFLNRLALSPEELKNQPQEIEMNSISPSPQNATISSPMSPASRNTPRSPTSPGASRNTPMSPTSPGGVPPLQLPGNSPVSPISPRPNSALGTPRSAAQQQSPASPNSTNNTDAVAMEITEVNSRSLHISIQLRFTHMVPGSKPFPRASCKEEECQKMYACML